MRAGVVDRLARFQQLERAIDVFGFWFGRRLSIDADHEHRARECRAQPESPEIPEFHWSLQTLNRWTPRVREESLRPKDAKHKIESEIAYSNAKPLDAATRSAYLLSPYLT